MLIRASGNTTKSGTIRHTRLSVPDEASSTPDKSQGDLEGSPCDLSWARQREGALRHPTHGVALYGRGVILPTAALTSP